MSKKAKYIVAAGKVSGGKNPRNTENPGSYLALRPVWRFNMADSYKDWSLFSADDLGEILEMLVDFERMSWNDIMKQTHGKDGKSSNHFVEVSKLIKEAQERFLACNLDEFSDMLFSLRLKSGKRRLYGILTDGIFHILWYDNGHEIYPSSKKHT